MNSMKALQPGVDAFQGEKPEQQRGQRAKEPAKDGEKGRVLRQYHGNLLSRGADGRDRNQTWNILEITPARGGLSRGMRATDVQLKKPGRSAVDAPRPGHSRVRLAGHEASERAWIGEAQ